jgi:hypothetical protein
MKREQTMSTNLAQTALDEIDRRLNTLEARVLQAAQPLTRRADPSEHCHVIAVLLDSLPLATVEFAVASSHVKNAMTYFRQGEAGAARFELHLILGTVRALRDRCR